MFKRPQNTMTASLTASLPQHNYEMLIDQLSKPKVIATNQNSAFKTSESTGTRRNNQQTTQLNLNIQCTETTRKRWERLQKPHGNQSSLLRHLLLLETYFRRGDLLLTPSAGPKAIAYAKSMQHRLQAYDNIPPRPVQVPPTSPQTNGTVCKSVEISFIL